MTKRELRLGDPASVTQLLAAYRAGDVSAFNRAFGIVYDDLRGLARRQLRRGRSPTLDTTGLVHELYLKLADSSRIDARDRAHLLALASRAMRQIVIDYARYRGRRKRDGGAQTLQQAPTVAGADEQAQQLLSIDGALHELKSVDERLVRVVECRFFAGLSEQDTARALGLSVSTVQRDWKLAKAWLRERLDGYSRN